METITTMNDAQYLVLARFYREPNGFSKDSFTNEYATHKEFFETQHIKLSEAWAYLDNKSFIESVDGKRWNDKTVFRITDLGKERFDYERQKRDLQTRRDGLQDQLRDSTISNNKLTPFITGLAALFSLVSLVIAGMECNKPNEEILPELQQIRSILQKQEKAIDSLERNSKAVATELNRIADSLHR